MHALILAIRVVQKLIGTKALKDIGATPLHRPLSECLSKHEYDSDLYWECAMRHNSLNVYHGSSSCKMGAASDKTAVVDPQLRY